MLTLQQIQEQAYATACEKGWHERPLREPKLSNVLDKPMDGWLVYHDRVLAKHALMHTELTEAAECLERGDLHMHVENGKPEGFAVEIADAIIRVCDTTAALGLTLHMHDGWLTGPALPHPPDVKLVAALWLSAARSHIDRATEAARVDDWNDYTNELDVVVAVLADSCTGLNIDLGEAITAKMSYNKTRPHRHGGKQA